MRLALSLVGSAAFQAARRLFAPAAGEEGRLSAREREVLSWTAIGRRQADIAAMLGLSERTVETTCGAFASALVPPPPHRRSAWRSAWEIAPDSR